MTRQASAELHPAEEALLESEERFRQMADNIDQLFWIIQIDPPRMLFASRAFDRIWGVPLDTLHGPSAGPPPLVHPEDEHAHLQHYIDAMEGPAELEFRILRPDGALRWLKTRTFPVRDRSGRTYRLAGVTDDVTDEKLALERVRASEGRLRLLHTLSTSVNAELSRDEAIARTVRLVSAAYPRLRVNFATVDAAGLATIRHSMGPRNLPSLAGGYVDLGEAREYLARVRSGEPVVVADAEAETVVTPLTSAILASGARAFIDVPLRLGEEDVSILGFDAGEVRTWTADEVDTLTEVAELLAVTLREARAHEERERAEQALRESESRFRALFDEAPDPYYLIDLDGCVVTWNRAAEELSGYAASEFVGQHYERVGMLPSSEFPKAAEGLAQSRAGLPTGPQQFSVRRRDGAVRTADVRTHLVTIGSQTLILGIARDVTDRVRVENELRASRTRLARAESVARVGNVDWDLDTGEIAWSDSIYDLLGVAPGSIEPSFEAYVDRLHPEDRDGVLASVGRLREQGETPGYDARLVLAGGVERTIHVESTAMVDGSGRSRRLFATVQDITDRKRIEDALQARTRQQAAVAELGQLALREDDVTRLLDAAVALVADVLGAPYCHVLELADDADLHVRARAGWPEDTSQRGAETRVGNDSHAGYTLRSALPVIVEDFAAEQRFRISPLLKRFGVKSGLSVIIPRASGQFGVLGVHTRSSRSFSEDDVNFVQAVANLLGQAIERAESVARLRLYQQQLRRLVSDVVLVEERERRRLAADLHDNTVQTLAMSRIKLGAAREASESEQCSEHLRELSALIEQTIHETRALLFELSPPVLYELGLVAAVEWLAERTREQHGIECTVEHDGVPMPLDGEALVVLFQAVRELLANVRKHARADRAAVTLGRCGDRIRIVVEDDGVGYAGSPTGARANEGGFGLFSIRERVGVLGGRLEIVGVPGQGTRVTVTAPLDLEQENQHDDATRSGRRSQDTP